MRRREFITLLSVAAVTWPLAARAQSPMPVVGFMSGRAPGELAHLVAAFRQADELAPSHAALPKVGEHGIVFSELDLANLFKLRLITPQIGLAVSELTRG